MNALWLLIAVGGTLGVLALASAILEAVERRRARHAEEKAARDRDEAYYRRCLETASQVGVEWPPAHNVVPFNQRRAM